VVCGCVVEDVSIMISLTVAYYIVRCTAVNNINAVDHVDGVRR